MLEPRLYPYTPFKRLQGDIGRKKEGASRLIIIDEGGLKIREIGRPSHSEHGRKSL